MTTATDIDVAALVGELEAPACESADHATPEYSQFHDGGPATHYARVQCPICGWGNIVKAYCATFVAALRDDCTLQCGGCPATLPASMMVTILGPVNA